MRLPCDKRAVPRNSPNIVVAFTCGSLGRPEFKGLIASAGSRNFRNSGLEGAHASGMESWLPRGFVHTNFSPKGFVSLFSKEALERMEREEQGLRKRTLLIVDDEEHNLTTLKYVLANHYDVLTASD